jgi:hypothetical protein
MYEAVEYVAQLRMGASGEELSPSEKLVLFVLANRLNRASSVAYPSVARVAQESAVGKRRVQQILRSLQRKGVVEVIYRKRQPGDNDTNHYRFPGLIPWLKTKPQAKSTSSRDEATCTPGANSSSSKPELEPESERDGDDTHARGENTPTSTSTPTSTPTSTSTPKPKPTSNVDADLHAVVHRAFKFYLETMKIFDLEYSDKRQKAGMAIATKLAKVIAAEVPDRAKQLESVERSLELVITRVSQSDWHMGRSPRSSRLSIDWCRDIFRDWETFERWFFRMN